MSRECGDNNSVLKTNVKMHHLKGGLFTHCFPVVPLLSLVSLCNAIDCSMPGFPVLHCLLEFVVFLLHNLISNMYIAYFFSFVMNTGSWGLEFALGLCV